MWAAIEWFFRAAAAYLQLLALQYPDQLKDECDDLEDQISKLRRSTDPADHTLADRLQLRLLRKRGVLADALSTANLGAAGKPADPDAARDLPPASK